ncbi:glycosyltransferase family 4 protein [Candidatus Daviesbacteria bacterium]|nr:glycosyltransferase family 4 protein [Candidatus Daviesbacteria bacterium]
MPGKSVDKLAQAFTSVLAKIPNAKLVIVGDDDEKNLIMSYLKRFIRRHKLQEKLLLFQGQFEIRKFHAVADVFCYPAIGKGLSVMEAMAVEVPIVAKGTDKKPFVVEDKISGLLTKDSSELSAEENQLADKLIYLLERPRVAKRMGKAGRIRIIKKFDFKKNIFGVLKVYHKTIKHYYKRPKDLYNYPSATF